MEEKFASICIRCACAHELLNKLKHPIDHIEADCPPPYPGLWEAYREIIPAILRQLKDPTHFVRRRLPAGSAPAQPAPAAATAA